VRSEMGRTYGIKVIKNKHLPKPLLTDSKPDHEELAPLSPGPF